VVLTSDWSILFITSKLWVTIAPISRGKIKQLPVKDLFRSQRLNNRHRHFLSIIDVDDLSS
jgi:hypothetical protein